MSSRSGVLWYSSYLNTVQGVTKCGGQETEGKEVGNVVWKVRLDNTR